MSTYMSHAALPRAPPPLPSWPWPGIPEVSDSLTGHSVLVHSRAVLQDVLDADLSNEAFPFSTHQLVRAAGHLVGSHGHQPLGCGRQQLLAKVGWTWESGI